MVYAAAGLIAIKSMISGESYSSQVLDFMLPGVHYGLPGNTAFRYFEIKFLM